jgi:hypothetical protein
MDASVEGVVALNGSEQDETGDTFSKSNVSSQPANAAVQGNAVLQQQKQQQHGQQKDWPLMGDQQVDDLKHQLELQHALQHSIDVRKSFSTMVRAWVIHLGVLLIGMGVVVLTVLANAEVIANSAAYRMRLRGLVGAGGNLAPQQVQQQTTPYNNNRVR